jgi:DNA-binding winged helix-turn-helix (wHTH) protein/TolB-like protein
MTQLGNIKGEPFHNGVFETKGAQYSNLSTKASLEHPNHRWYDLNQIWLPPMQSATVSTKVFRFGLFEADAARSTLSRSGVRVKLQDQPFRVLLLLLERAGEIVSREELRQKLWPDGTYVDFDGSLNAVLKKLRAAIDDDSDNPRFIETVPRRGYRFIAPVSSEAESSSTLAPTESNSGPQLQSAPATPRASWMQTRRGLAIVLVSFAVAFIGWKYLRKPPASVAASQTVVAVVPFINEGAGPDFDFLRYAIADDLVTDLSHAHSVSVRPFASTSKYASQPADPATIGAELRVTHVVAGGFLVENNQLMLSLELVDIGKNQPVWREQVSVAPGELIKLHQKLATTAALGILPALNVSPSSMAHVPHPNNEQALDLFFHSLTLPFEPEPNRLAIKKLEQSVSLDNSYAPAWQQLAWRYYMDFHYGDAGDAAISKSLEASKRQAELDPNTPPVSIAVHVEQGELNDAYDQAAQFLRRRPDSSMAHFWMSYVYRYAGVLDSSQRECEAGLALDPGFNLLRSCAFSYLMAGDYEHAQLYISLDQTFGAWARLRIAMRKGDSAAVLKESSAAAKSGFSRASDLVTLFHGCLNHAPEAELRKTMVRIETDPVAALDREIPYQIAEDFAFCGQTEAALRQLRNAIQGNYCSYQAMDDDPVFEAIRRRPEYAELRAAAVQCQESFLAHRQHVDSAYASK